MGNIYQEALIYGESEDGQDLAGVIIRPDKSSPETGTTILWIHGNTGSFYEYPYIILGRTLAAQGYTFISGNTRGHDVTTFVWNMQKGQREAAGSAWELLEEAPYDLAGWIAAARQQGAEHVILAGHSLAAMKVIHYLATRQDSRVDGLILASPDLHGHWSPELVAAARQKVDTGQGDDLMPALMNTPAYRLSAANVVSRNAMLRAVYAGDHPYLSQVTCPILAFYGTAGDIGGTQELEMIASKSTSAQLTTALIEHADHVYFDQHEAVAKVIIDWITTPLS